ncbi:MAG: hypothetical protein HY820_44795 [Acidobacteria bacterium]|nr:hypothetical protein [Acidobacteriota bacterium]
MAYAPKTKYNYKQFLENGGSLKKWMNQGDLHFVFNSCLGSLQLKCFDYGGRLVWSAFPRLEMDSDRMEIVHDLGIPHVLHTGEPHGMPWCWCVWGNPADRSGGVFKEIMEYDQKGSLLRFVLAGCSAKEFPQEGCMSVATYALVDADFQQLRSFVLGRRCLMTPHYSEK